MMPEDTVIEYGRAWLEIVNYYKSIEFTDQKSHDLTAALMRLAFKRFERAYINYMEDQIKVEEATRRIEDEVAELLGTIES